VTTKREVIFDGDCGLCRACVDWMLRHDSSGGLTATPSSHCTWDDAEKQPFLDTVVVRTESGQTFYRSNAVAEVLCALPGPWKYHGRLLRLVNRLRAFQAFHDWCYNLVSKNRRSISNVLVRLRVLDSSCRMPARSEEK